MKPLKHFQLQKEISSGSIRPLYFFFGAEDFLQEQSCSEIIKRFIPEDNREFNVDRVEGRELTLDNFSSLFSGMTFFGARRVVVIRNTESITALAAGRIADAVENISEDTVVVFTSSKSKFPARNALIPVLQKKACCVIFYPMFPSSIESWAREYLKACGGTIDAGALKQLIVFSDENPRIVKTEIDKILVFLGSKKNITLQDVKAVLGQNKSWNVYEMDEMLYKKDVKQGLECINNLMKVRHNELLIMNYLFRVVKRLLFAKLLMKDNNYSRDEISKTLRLHSFHDNDFFEKTGIFSIEELEKGIRSLAKAEYKIKTGGGAPMHVLSKLWITLCRPDPLPS